MNQLSRVRYHALNGCIHLERLERSILRIFSWSFLGGEAKNQIGLLLIVTHYYITPNTLYTATSPANERMSPFPYNRLANQAKLPMNPRRARAH